MSTRSRLTICVSLALRVLVCVGLLFSFRRVASAGPRRLAIYVEGNDAAQTRAAIARGAPSSVVVDDGDFGRALKRGGAVPLGKLFDEPRSLGERARRAMEGTPIDLVVLARVHPTRTGRAAHLFLFSRSGGDPEADQTVVLGKKPADTDARALSGALLPALSRLSSGGTQSAPSSPEPRRQPTESASASTSTASTSSASSTLPPPEEPSEPKPYEVTRAMLTLELDGGVGARKFDYNDRITANLRPYSVWAVPMFGGQATFYPFARKPGALSHLGLVAAYAQALAFNSALSTGNGELKTYYDFFEVGPRYRVPLGARSMLGIGATFGGEDFTFHAAGALAPELASVRYRYVRAGLDVRVPLSSVGLLAGAGYRFVLQGGRVSDRFPHASLGGADAMVGLALPLGSSKLELRAAVRYHRYFYKMNPEPHEPYIAGGAADQFFVGEGGLALGF